MEPKLLSYEVKGQALIYKMPKEIDHHVAGRLCKELDVLIDAHQCKELVLDFKETEFMDSSGIGIVIGRSKNMKFHEGSLSVANMSARMQTIFQSSGLYQLVSIREV